MVFTQFGKKIFMIKLNKNKFSFLTNNFILLSLIITLINFHLNNYELRGLMEGGRVKIKTNPYIEIIKFCKKKKIGV